MHAHLPFLVTFVALTVAFRFKVAAAAFVHSEGTLVLTSSVFRLNRFATGIVNLGGEVQCGEMECLPVCTACALVPSPTPLQLPTTVAPIVVVTAAPTAEQILADDATDRAWPIYVAICLGLLAIVVAALRYRTVRRYVVGLSNDSTVGASVSPSNQEPLLQLDDNTLTELRSVELVERSVMIRSYETSPAPVFVVGRDSMRISLWSPGMAIAAPMVRNPVGGLLSDLPFVNASDGDQLDQFLKQVFSAPAEHDHARTCMLHLRTQNRHVLLEMVATHFFVRDSESIVVMTGRQVDSDLAVLLACETIAASEATHDVNADEVWGESSHFQSVSQAGSIKGDDDDDNMSHISPADDRESDDVNPSVASSLATPALKPASKICGGSTVSSLTTPTMHPGPSVSSLPMRTFRSVRPPASSEARGAAEVCHRADRDHIVAREKMRGGSVASSSADDDDSTRADRAFVDRSEVSDPGLSDVEESDDDDVL